ncbi:41515_t:CDS:2, partial [Gigaspora margarita]
MQYLRRLGRSSMEELASNVCRLYIIYSLIYEEFFENEFLENRFKEILKYLCHLILRYLIPSEKVKSDRVEAEWYGKIRPIRFVREERLNQNEAKKLIRIMPHHVMVTL